MVVRAAFVARIMLEIRQESVLSGRPAREHLSVTSMSDFLYVDTSTEKTVEPTFSVLRRRLAPNIVSASWDMFGLTENAWIRVNV